jgi:Tol biopolymer transport system component
VGQASGQLVSIDRDGKVTGTLSAAGFPHLTSDGQHVAVASHMQGNFDIWLIDTTRGVPRRFTFDPAIDIFPVWSPDGSHLIFSSNRKGTFDLFEKPASLARDEQVLLFSADNKFPVDWSPDGRVLLYVNQDSATGDDLWALPLEGTPTPVRVVQTRFSEDQGQFSPDGRWIAYRSNEAGPREIFLRPFPGPGSQRQVSTRGGSQPRWRRDGKELFYIAADNRLMAVPIHLPSANETPDIGVPFPLFATRLAAPSNAQHGYAVAPDGRFLMNVIGDESSAAPITIVQNWTAGLKK